MLKHPSETTCNYSCWYPFICVLFPLESTQSYLNRFKNVSNSVWIDSCLNHFIPSWVISSNSMTLFESIHTNSESIQSFILATWIVSNLTWLSSIFIYFPSFLGLPFCCLNQFTSLMNRFTLLFLCKNLYLVTPHYINPSHHNSQIIESFASILSRSQKLIVHTFFKIKHFFLESLCSLSV